MICALGWILESPSGRFRTGCSADGVSLVTWEAEGPFGGREILAQQLSVARAADAFLPTSRALAADPGRAASLTARCGGVLADHLRQQGGSLQVSLRLAEKAAPASQRPLTSLRERAAAHRSAASRLAEGRSALDDLVARLGAGASVKIAARRGGLNADFLTRPDVLDAFLARLQKEILDIGRARLGAWQCTLAGPLPPLAFTPELEAP